MVCVLPFNLLGMGGGGLPPGTGGAGLAGKDGPFISVTKAEHKICVKQTITDFSFFFLFCFDLVFTALSRIFHLPGISSQSFIKGGRNLRTAGEKPPDHP